MALKFIVGMCPSPAIDDSVEYENRKDSISTSRNGDDVEVTVYMCPSGAQCDEGLLVAIKMCPDGETCGCSYDISDLRWHDTGQCGIYFTWHNPDRCVLRKVTLQRISWWDSNWVLKYMHERTGDDPDLPIYPQGDPRNDEGCRDCGIGGADENHAAGSESIYESSTMVPGQLYKVSCWFDDIACGGRETKIDLAYLVYQTTGLTSGQITAKPQNDPPRYTVQHYERSDGDLGYSLVSRNYYSVDYYPFEIGDPVMLCKVGTSFPDGYYGGDIDDDSVQQPTDTANYLIVPYNQVEG